jgi:hypothetical protein
MREVCIDDVSAAVIRREESNFDHKFPRRLRLLGMTKSFSGFYGTLLLHSKEA